MPNIHMKDNINEKAMKLEFAKSEDIFHQKISAESTANMTVLKQKWKNIGEKGETFYQYFKDNKLYQIKGCMSAEVRAIVGLGFPQKPYLKNANVCMNNVLNPAGSK